MTNGPAAAEVATTKPIGVAILGGSFNPVTNAHLAIAHHVLDQVESIREVWLMPTYMHRFGKHHDYLAQRIAMIKAVETPAIRYCGFEVEHQLGDGTFATLTQMLAAPQYRGRYEFSFIVGADCVLEFDQRWRQPQALAALVRFLIVPRPGVDLSEYRGFLAHSPHRVLTGFTPLTVSSSQVRACLKRGESIADMVPSAVARLLTAPTAAE